MAKFMIYSLICLSAFTYCVSQTEVNKTSNIGKILQKCHRSDTHFDSCLKNAINTFRSSFKVGAPEYGVPPFDPFFAETVSTSRGGRSFHFNITVKNVFERGWSQSKITALKTNIEGKSLRYYQHFPEKYLDGEWEVFTNILPEFHNEGKFDLSLYNYTQVTNIKWTDREKPFSVRIDALECGDLKLHLTNLIGGRVFLESVMDRIINTAWRPGFEMFKPIINDLVSNAFTKILNDSFKKFPFEELIPA